ncbi:MAG: choice-of-anchor B family protein [candidate division Zixibacteria bacterium]|nr:choice-of-anchor B family protein [candidate division Zixibacteria bacterium]
MQFKHTCFALAVLISVAAAITHAEAQKLPDPANWFGTGINQEQLIENPIAEGIKSPARSALAAQADPDVEALWVGATRWMRGVSHTGGETFFNSVGRGEIFFGSNLTASQFVPIELRFSNVTTSVCRTFRRDLGYASSGVGTFPGSAWDMSNPGSPRRLNICFVEASTEGAPNLTWDPNATSLGKREYVFIMLSNYDGTGATYNGVNIQLGASNLDVVYGWWPMLETGFTLMQVLPATLAITPYYVKNFRAIPASGKLTLTWTCYLPGVDHYRLYNGPSSPAANLISSPSSSSRTFSHSGLTDGVTQHYRIEAVDAANNVLGFSRNLTAIPKNMSSNMTLTGYWHERSSYGGIWGYTDSITGKEYALVCARDEGVSVIDIAANPPVEVSFLPSISPGKDTKEVKVYRHYIITCKETEAAQIFDVSDIENPVQVSTVGTGAHTHNIYKNYLILNGQSINAFNVYNITNPAAPTFVSHFTSFYYHDTDIRNDILAGAGIYGTGVEFVDISNIAAPVRIGGFNYTGSGTHNVEFSDDGNYLYVGDEIGTHNWTRVFDIADINSVSLVSQMILDSVQPVHNSYVKDSFLYIGHYSHGVRVWNVADPLNPFEAGYYDTYQPNVIGYEGCWTVYPFFASGKLVASDLSTGLYVLTFDPLTPPCCTGSTGNVDCDPGDASDISDLTALIDNLFISLSPLCCENEANTDGTGGVDISDLTALIDFLFISLAPTAPCQ